MPDDGRGAEDGGADDAEAAALRKPERGAARAARRLDSSMTEVVHRTTLDRDAPTPLQRPPAHASPERMPPVLDLSPNEVETLDQGVKAALTIGMLDPQRSATDNGATAKVLQYIRDQRERFTAAAVAGQALHFAPAPSGPVTMITLGMDPAKRCARHEDCDAAEERASERSLERSDFPGGFHAHAAEDPKESVGTFARATPALQQGVQQLRAEQCSPHGSAGRGPRCLRRAGHSQVGEGCTDDPERARELDARDFKAAR